MAYHWIDVGCLETDFEFAIIALRIPREYVLGYAVEFFECEGDFAIFLVAVLVKLGAEGR